MIGVIAARLLLGVALLALPAGSTPAHAAAGLEFLDPRPVIIPLDDSEPGQQWAVQVLSFPGGDQDVRLHVVFEPSNVITVDPAPASQDGGIIEFVIELERRVEGSGELVAVSNGTVARRPISTEFPPAAATSAVGELQFSGERIAPFTGLVRIPPLVIPSVPSAAGAAPPQRVGLLTSEHGDVAEVVREGNTIAVHGVRRAGEYTGVVSVNPRSGGEDGHTATATVRVRDFALWPLLVLLGGLSVAHLLDRYQHRQRPQRLLERRLAELRNQARAASRLAGGRVRITGSGADSDGLLLDQLIAEARTALHPRMSETERSAWEPGGADYDRLAAVVARFQQLCHSFRGLQDVHRKVIDWIEPGDRDRAARALERSVVGTALRDRPIRSLVDLDAAERPLAEALGYLDDFATIYRTTAKYLHHDQAEARAQAELVLAQLLRAPRELRPVEDAADELDDRWALRLAKEPDGYPPPPTWSGRLDEDEVLSPQRPWTQPAGPPGDYGPPDGSGPPRSRGRMRPISQALVVAAAVAVAALVVGSLFDAGGNGALVGPDQEGPPPTTSPPVTPPPTGIPNAPVARLDEAPIVPVLGVTTPSAGQSAWYGIAAPLMLVVAVAVVTGLLVRWRRARQRPRAEVPDSDQIDKELRREELRYSAIAGVLVVLSGMSLLYVGNPTFGTIGDYLALALWGAAVGEGLELARRLWPSLPRP